MSVQELHRARAWAAQAQGLRDVAGSGGMVVVCTSHIVLQAQAYAQHAQETAAQLRPSGKV